LRERSRMRKPWSDLGGFLPPRGRSSDSLTLRASVSTPTARARPCALHPSQSMLSGLSQTLSTGGRRYPSDSSGRSSIYGRRAEEGPTTVTPPRGSRPAQDKPPSKGTRECDRVSWHVSSRNGTVSLVSESEPRRYSRTGYRAPANLGYAARICGSSKVRTDGDRERNGNDIKGVTEWPGSAGPRWAQRVMAGLGASSMGSASGPSHIDSTGARPSGKYPEIPHEHLPGQSFSLGGGYVDG
jgi:hypothetical protein